MLNNLFVSELLFIVCLILKRRSLGVAWLPLDRSPLEDNKSLGVLMLSSEMFLTAGFIYIVVKSYLWLY